MDVTFSINGTDLSAKLTKYSAIYENDYAQVVKTLDGHEHGIGGGFRPVINFMLWPDTDTTAADLYDLLKDRVVSVTFLIYGEVLTRDMRVTSNLENVFGIKSIDGNRYYKGGEIQLRGVLYG